MTDTVICGNLFRDIPDKLPEELFGNLLSTETFRIERIVSRGHASPEGFWYDQEDGEWVLLLNGSAALCFDDRPEPLVLGPGDYVQINPHVRHRIEWTAEGQDTVWLAIHYRPA